MNTETPQTTPPPAIVIPSEFPLAFDHYLACLAKIEERIKQLRVFIEKWKPALLMCESWSACPMYTPSITIRKGYGEHCEHFNPKKIARAFGSEGWKRHKNAYTCGQIDWKKQLDGIDLEIEGAEIVKLNPIEEVKL